MDEPLLILNVAERIARHRTDERTGLVIAALAVAFAAFCVWLTVRIVNRKERWAKLTLAAMIGVPALYVTSFGPACWICSRMDDQRLPGIYVPFKYVLHHDGAGLSDAVVWWGGCGLGEDDKVELSLNRRSIVIYGGNPAGLTFLNVNHGDYD